ncbi:hypothetical protein [Pseudomonas guariconensis]|uniref:hypothetical protein n=1 Tax=Pseudomonas guariconensis TaxID=1288410 RepID=UPI003906CE97
MSFLESIQAGINKATQADINVQQVNNLLTSITNEIQTISSKQIRLVKTVSTLASIKQAAASFDSAATPKEFFDADQLCLTLEKRSVPVARWRQNKEGFPCILTFDGAEFICDDASELTAALKLLLSTANFGKILKEMMDS